ncbi:MAG TPA: sugar phosphate isomerase/epimerase family protein [Bryobacteraceae bacterium]|jgi:sugar phosphate isomerase/epimerase
MKHALSTHLFVNHRLTTAGLERIQSAGFEAVEIFCARQHMDYHDQAQINELGHWFRDSQMELHSLHAPMYSDDVWGRSGPNAVMNITERLKAKRMAVVDEIKRAIEIAETVPCRYLIQHLGVQEDEMDERKLDAAFSSLDEIRVFAAQRGVEVLLENIPNELALARRLNDFLAQTHLNLNYCFDVGHAHMTNGITSEFELMKERIRSTHLHDNDGHADLHLFPGQGTIDWHNAMRLLRSRPEQYPLVLELKEIPGMERPAEDAKRAIEDLDRFPNTHER